MSKQFNVQFKAGQFDLIRKRCSELFDNQKFHKTVKNIFNKVNKSLIKKIDVELLSANYFSIEKTADDNARELLDVINAIQQEKQDQLQDAIVPLLVLFVLALRQYKMLKDGELKTALIRQWEDFGRTIEKHYPDFNKNICFAKKGQDYYFSLTEDIFTDVATKIQNDQPSPRETSSSSNSSRVTFDESTLTSDMTEVSSDEEEKVQVVRAIQIAFEEDRLVLKVNDRELTQLQQYKDILVYLADEIEKKCQFNRYALGMKPIKKYLAELDSALAEVELEKVIKKFLFSAIDKNNPDFKACKEKTLKAYNAVLFALILKLYENVKLPFIEKVNLLESICRKIAPLIIGKVKSQKIFERCKMSFDKSEFERALNKHYEALLHEFRSTEGGGVELIPPLDNSIVSKVQALRVSDELFSPTYNERNNPSSVNLALPLSRSNALSATNWRSQIQATAEETKDLDIPPPLPPRPTKALEVSSADEAVEVFSRKDAIRQSTSSALAIRDGQTKARLRQHRKPQEDKISVQMTTQIFRLFAEQTQQLKGSIPEEVMAGVLRQERMMNRMYRVDGVMFMGVQRYNDSVHAQQTSHSSYARRRALTGAPTDALPKVVEVVETRVMEVTPGEEQDEEATDSRMNSSLLNGSSVSPVVEQEQQTASQNQHQAGSSMSAPNHTSVEASTADPLSACALIRVITQAVESYVEWLNDEKGPKGSHGDKGEHKAMELQRQVFIRASKFEPDKPMDLLAEICALLHDFYNNDFKDREGNKLPGKARYKKHSFISFLINVLKNDDDAIRELNSMQGQVALPAFDKGQDYTSDQDGLKTVRENTFKFFKEIKTTPVVTQQPVF